MPPWLTHRHTNYWLVSSAALCMSEQHLYANTICLIAF